MPASPLPSNLINLILSWEGGDANGSGLEGRRADGLYYPYYDYNGQNYSVGFGSEAKSKDQAGLTLAQVQALALPMIERAAAGVDSAIPEARSKLTPEQYAALVSINQNAGVVRPGSPIANAVNSGNMGAVPGLLSQITKTKTGQELPGLVNRRAAEVALWNGDKSQYSRSGATMYNPEAGSSAPQTGVPSDTVSEPTAGSTTQIAPAAQAPWEATQNPADWYTQALIGSDPQLNYQGAVPPTTSGANLDWSSLGDLANYLRTGDTSFDGVNTPPTPTPPVDENAPQPGVVQQATNGGPLTGDGSWAQPPFVPDAASEAKVPGGSVAPADLQSMWYDMSLPHPYVQNENNVPVVQSEPGGGGYTGMNVPTVASQSGPVGSPTMAAPGPPVISVTDPQAQYHRGIELGGVVPQESLPSLLKPPSDTPSPGPMPAVSALPPAASPMASQAPGGGVPAGGPPPDLLSPTYGQTQTPSLWDNIFNNPGHSPFGGTPEQNMQFIGDRAQDAFGNFVGTVGGGVLDAGKGIGDWFSGLMPRGEQYGPPQTPSNGPQVNPDYTGFTWPGMDTPNVQVYPVPDTSNPYGPYPDPNAGGYNPNVGMGEGTGSWYAMSQTPSGYVQFSPSEIGLAGNAYTGAGGGQAGEAAAAGALTDPTQNFGGIMNAAISGVTPEAVQRTTDYYTDQGAGMGAFAQGLAQPAMGMADILDSLYQPNAPMSADNKAMIADMGRTDYGAPAPGAMAFTDEANKGADGQKAITDATSGTPPSDWLVGLDGLGSTVSGAVQNSIGGVTPWASLDEANGLAKSGGGVAGPGGGPPPTQGGGFQPNPTTGVPLSYAAPDQGAPPPAPTYAASDPYARPDGQTGGIFPIEGMPGSFSPGVGSIDQQSLESAATAQDQSAAASVICSHFKEIGRLPKEIHGAARMYTLRLPKYVMNGYHVWAVPTVRYLRTKTSFARLAEDLLWHVCRNVANELAHRVRPKLTKGSWKGAIYVLALYPLCAVLGKKAGVADIAGLWRNT